MVWPGTGRVATGPGRGGASAARRMGATCAAHLIAAISGVSLAVALLPYT
jgi:hypothetical protein